VINIRISVPTVPPGRLNRIDRTSGDSKDPHEFEAIIEKTAFEVLRYASNPPEVEVTLVLTGDAQIRKLNRDFLGIDAPTDVLAFPGGERDPDTGSLYLGDVVISYQRAQAQSGTARHSIEDELQLLVVHGMLHLLGYDHADETSKTTMWKTQHDILQKVTLSTSTPHADISDSETSGSETSGSDRLDRSAKRDEPIH
jgi:probable rRNA maturation factor